MQPCLSSSPQTTAAFITFEPACVTQDGNITEVCWSQCVMDEEPAAACNGHRRTSEAAHLMHSTFYTLYIPWQTCSCTRSINQPHECTFIFCETALKHKWCLKARIHATGGGGCHPAKINDSVWHFHLWATRSRAWQAAMGPRALFIFYLHKRLFWVSWSEQHLILRQKIADNRCVHTSFVWFHLYPSFAQYTQTTSHSSHLHIISFCQLLFE